MHICPGSACISFKGCMAVNLTSGACCPSSAGIRWGLRRFHGPSAKMFHLTRWREIWRLVISHEMYPFYNILYFDTPWRTRKKAYVAAPLWGFHWVVGVGFREKQLPDICRLSCCDLWVAAGVQGVPLVFTSKSCELLFSLHSGASWKSTPQVESISRESSSQYL